MLQETEYLAQFITPEKKERIEQVLSQRTKHLVIALENIFQEHNASAILRSADCFGVLDIYAIEDVYRFKVIDGMSLGAAKWLNVHPYRSTKECLQAVKKKGYRVVAATPERSFANKQSTIISELDVSTPLVMLFGTEKEGLSNIAHTLADQFVTIPMYGFTQSLNVSVSAALCMYRVIERMRKNNVVWQLTQQERCAERLCWYRRVVKWAR